MAPKNIAIRLPERILYVHGRVSDAVIFYGTNLLLPDLADHLLAMGITVILKPFNIDQLMVVVGRAMETSRLRRENSDLRRRETTSADMLGSSAAFRGLKAQLDRPLDFLVIADPEDRFDL